jgi:3-oxoacyl-[acyl-carrier-protein] synthase II
VVAPNGIGKDAFWSSCINGRSAAGRIRSFDTSNHPAKIAAEVADFDVSRYLSNGVSKNVKIMSRAMQFGVAAANLAVADSGLNMVGEHADRIGVVMGAGIVPFDLAELAPTLTTANDENGRLDPSRLGNDGLSSLAPLWILKLLPNMIAAHISLAVHAQGPNSTITTACAAGTQAVGESMRLIQRGEADIVLAGGADSRIDPLLLLGYTALRTLSPATRAPSEVSRPFDAQRDGFVMGEGAAVLVIEEFERARRRGAQVYAEVLGSGSSFDAYSTTRPDPSAKGAINAIQWALRDARVDHRDVDYINAHGTSTRLNDIMETTAVKHVFQSHARRLALSSIKSMIGHLIGAAGAVEAACLALTLRHGVLPPTINQTHPDPECDLDYVPNSARVMPIQTAVSTSFGFGGQNAALVMGRV